MGLLRHVFKTFITWQHELIDLPRPTKSSYSRTLGTATSSYSENVGTTAAFASSLPPDATGCRPMSMLTCMYPSNVVCSASCQRFLNGLNGVQLSKRSRRNFGVLNVFGACHSWTNFITGPNKKNDAVLRLSVTRARGSGPGSAAGART